MRKCTAAVLGVAIGTMPLGVIAQTSYTSNSATGAWNTNRWNNSTDGPSYASAYTANNAVLFSAGNYSFAGMGSTVNVGNVTLNPSVSVNFSSTGGTFGTNALVRTLDVGAGSFLDFGSQSFSSSATTGFIKNGSGNLGLAGNTYAGGFTLNDGGVLVRGINAMGAGGSLTINGGTIAGNGNRDLSGKYSGGITIGGDFQIGALPANMTSASKSAVLTFTNSMAIGDSIRTITVGNDATHVLGGVISGAGGVSFSQLSGASGNVNLTASNNYQGGTTVTGGSVNLGHITDTLLDSGSVEVNGGTLAIGANSDTVGAVTLTSGSITGSGGTLTGSSYDVRSGSISAKLGGNGALTKSTAGTVTLSGANTYSGTTTVQQGTLSLATTGSISSSSSIDVQSGATLDVSAVGAFTVGSGKTLKGNGTVKGNPTVAGNLTPGASAGLLTVDGSLTLSSATLNYEIEGAGTVRGAHASNGYDAVDVVTTSGGTGALTYDGTLNLDFEAGAPSAGSSYDFFNFASASGSFDDINVLFGGVDQNVTWAQNLGIWTSTLGSVVYTFTGSNGVLSLSASAVPEPLTAAGVILLAGRVLGRRNRASL